MHMTRVPQRQILAALAEAFEAGELTLRVADVARVIGVDEVLAVAAIRPLIDGGSVEVQNRPADPVGGWTNLKLTLQGWDLHDDVAAVDLDVWLDRRVAAYSESSALVAHLMDLDAPAGCLPLITVDLRRAMDVEEVQCHRYERATERRFALK